MYVLEGFFDVGYVIWLVVVYFKVVLDIELVVFFVIDELLDYCLWWLLMIFKIDYFIYFDDFELSLYVLCDSIGILFLLLVGLELDLKWEWFIIVV